MMKCKSRFNYKIMRNKSSKSLKRERNKQKIGKKIKKKKDDKKKNKCAKRNNKDQSYKI